MNEKRRLPLLLAALSSVALFLSGCCRAREVRHEMTWTLTTTGLCDAPGRSTHGQKEVTLRYVKYPDYFEVLCSTKVADHLVSVGTNPVWASFLYTPSTKGRSLCELGGVKGTPLGSGPLGRSSCGDLGHESGGFSNRGGPPSGNPFP